MSDVLSEKPPPAKWIGRNSVSLGLATRIVAASVLTFVLCHVLGLKSQWAILTAIVVMQSSVGASLKATLDRFAGSIGGAFWGVCVLVAFPRDTALATGLALAVTLVPLGLVAAFKPAYRIAPITGVILLLTPMLPDTAPWEVGLDRILEVGIGSMVALAVALIIFPVRAHEALARAASDALCLLADLLHQLSETMACRDDPRAISALHHEIRHAITRAEDIAEDAVQERTSYLVQAPDPRPICRTLRRLTHDLTMIGRTVESSFPAPLIAPLADTAEQTAVEIATYLRRSAEALASRESAPSMAEVEQALAVHSAAVAEARRSGMTRDLPDEQVERIFGLSFGFMQLFENLADLAARTDEFAGARVRRRRRLLP